jgi:hypothetical protein
MQIVRMGEYSSQRTHSKGSHRHIHSKDALSSRDFLENTATASGVANAEVDSMQGRAGSSGVASKSDMSERSF